MSSPSTTYNAFGNLVSNSPLAASTTSPTTIVDVSTKFDLQIQLDVLTGGVSGIGSIATLQVFRLFGVAGSNPDTVPYPQLALTMGVASTHFAASIPLSTGKYAVQVINGDTHAINYSLTTTTVDSIA